MELEFRIIPNYENYSISNIGILKNNKTNNIIKPWIAGSNYLYCRIINKDGHFKTTVHNLVALCFLGEKPPNFEIDHIDRNKQNNNFTNLRYVSRSDNMKNINIKLRPNINKKDEFYNIKTIKSNNIIEGYTVVIKSIYYGFYKKIDDAIEKRNLIIQNINF